MDGGARTIIPRRRSSSMPDIIAAASSKQQPQISDMFQKFALALKSKTYELFSDDQPPPPGDNEDAADEIILGQRVVVLKPDSSSTNTAPPSVPPTQAQDDLAPPALQAHPDPDSPLPPRQEPELENGCEFSLAGRIDLRIIETQSPPCLRPFQLSRHRMCNYRSRTRPLLKRALNPPTKRW